MEKKKFLFFVLIAALLFVGVLGAVKIYADNTNFDLYGIGWSAHDNKGIGWVVLNSGVDAKGMGGESFKVSVKNRANDKGTLEGQGWASIKDPKTGNDSYGWISFDVNKLTGCPDGNCKAILDYTTGAISGWAKFICVAGGCGTGSGSEVGSWDGWVSLRNDPSAGVRYGLCLGRIGEIKKTFNVDDGKGGLRTLEYITGEKCQWDKVINNNQVEVNGMAWAGSSIGGWIVFGNSASVLTLGLTPSDPVTLFPREKWDFSVEKSSSWFVNNNYGGNINTVGSISPKDTVAKDKTIYQAPNSGGPYTIKASSTVSGEIATTTATVKFPYTLSCEPSGTSTMILRWLWSKSPVDSEHGGGYLGYAAHNISVTRIPDSGATKLIVDKKPGEVSGNFTDTGISTSTKYTYKLDVNYTSFVYATSTRVVGCYIPTAIPTSDIPSKLKAFATDDKTIYINWKDNTTTTQPYKFNLQRIKLTPASSTDVKIKDGTTDQSINLEWKNNTTSTPYYSVLERSTSTSNRFKKSVPSSSSDDKLMVRIDRFDAGNNSPSAGLKTYPITDPGLQEATTYYYRVRACSTYRDSSLEKSYENDHLNNETVDKPNPVCGKYAPSPELPMVPPDLYGGGTPSVATTTLPKTPTNATSTASYTTGVHSITLKWDDNSKRETGYQIWRNEILIHEANYNSVGVTAIGVNALSHTDSPTSNNKSSSRLDPGTFYQYKIRAYYIIPAENGGDGVTTKVYSNWVTTNTHTYYQVDLTIRDSGMGTASGPGNLANCSNKCTEYFPWDTTPTVKVDESANPDYAFVNWSEVSCNGGNGNASCIFNRGNTKLDANFEQVVFGLTAQSPGSSGKIFGSGINCGNGGTTCNAAISKGDSVSLTAIPAINYSFNSWSGVCSGSNPLCSFTMPSNDETVGASFSQSTFQLSVGRSEPYATGTVISNPTGINCSCNTITRVCTGCLGSFEAGENITLTATPGVGAKFVSWSGACSGTSATCLITLNGNTTVFAKFAPSSGGNMMKGSFFADLWSNAQYMWKGLFVDHSQERVSALSANFSNIVKGFRDGWNNITSLFSETMKQAEEAATKLAQNVAQNVAQVAEGQSAGDPMDVYFKSIATTSMSSYIDQNLEPDTVYLYRVKLIYESPMKIAEPSSNSGATKTLRDISGGGGTNKGVCTRNSFCDFSVKSYSSSLKSDVKVPTEKTEQQCTTNIECKNIGRYGQSFQER